MGSYSNVPQVFVEHNALLLRSGFFCLLIDLLSFLPRVSGRPPPGHSPTRSAGLWRVTGFLPSARADNQQAGRQTDRHSYRQAHSQRQHSASSKSSEKLVSSRRCKKMDEQKYFALKKQGVTSSAATVPVNSTPGSNKAQWNAMDLQIGRGFSSSGAPGRAFANTTSGSGSLITSSTIKANDKSALSARNILIRHKLMERKRFDSADYAMKQKMLGNTTGTAPSAPVPSEAQSSVDELKPAVVKSVEPAAPFSPAHVGASVFFNAMDDGTEDVDMDTEPVEPKKEPQQVPSPQSRYGNLAPSSKTSSSMRNVLLQNKLREKKIFDSADYQLAKFRSSANKAGAEEAQSRTSASGTNAGHKAASLPLTIGNESVVDAAMMNSPMATRVVQNEFAQMSPSARQSGRYGGLGNPSGQLSRKRVDPADDPMEGPSTGGTAWPQPAPRSSDAPAVTAPPAPQNNTPSTSKYGKLCAANVLIRKHLKERKRFDSADYAMERQSGQAGVSDTQGGSAGALRGGHIVPSVEQDHAASSRDLEDHSHALNHQVKHIKLSEGHGRWASHASAKPTSALAQPKSSGAAIPQDRLVARHMLIQRRLTERKRFDSADYFKEAASRG